MKKVKEVLAKQLGLSRPSQEINEKIDIVSKKFVGDLRAKLKSRKIGADVFVGGSIAKKTLVKKGVYDIDVFVRFDKKYEDDKISSLLGKVLAGFGGLKKVHGSRDYYQLKVEDILIEVVPVLKISKPLQAVNVTDLSYFHVNYILKKLRANKKLGDEIVLAKAFAHAQGVYGAESYIHGFSGYGLELMTAHYGSFLKMIKEISKSEVSKDKKIVIDDAGFYKNKNEILIELNESKLQSPIVLIDPTFKERNATSSLSYETFNKFKTACYNFLKSPSLEFFNKKDIAEDFERFDTKIVSVKTDRQAGDIAGTKSKKFFDFFVYKLRKEFEIKKSGFDYDYVLNSAKFYFVVEPKKEEIVKGPPVVAVNNLTKFKKAHPKAFIKKGYAYVRIKHLLSFEEWFKEFVKKEKKIIREMSVVDVGV